MEICSREQFKIAKYAVENTLAHAHETGEWRIAPDVISDFETLLSLHAPSLQARDCMRSWKPSDS